MYIDALTLSTVSDTYLQRSINKLDGTIKKTVNKRLYLIHKMRVLLWDEWNELVLSADRPPNEVYTDGRENTLYFVMAEENEGHRDYIKLFLNGVPVFGEKIRYDTAIVLAKIPEGD